MNPIKDWRLAEWLTAGGFVCSLISLIKGWQWTHVWNDLTAWKLLFCVSSLGLMGRLGFYLWNRLESQRQKQFERLVIEVEKRVHRANNLADRVEQVEYQLKQFGPKS